MLVRDAEGVPGGVGEGAVGGREGVDEAQDAESPVPAPPVCD